MTFKITIPFVGNDTTTGKVIQMINYLNMGTIEKVEMFTNYDSQKDFRTVEVTFVKLYYNSNSRKVVEQLNIGGEVIVKMVTHKTSRWILRSYLSGGLMGVRPKNDIGRVYITV